jgi:hypothetical protein
MEKSSKIEYPKGRKGIILQSFGSSSLDLVRRGMVDVEKEPTVAWFAGPEGLRGRLQALNLVSYSARAFFVRADLFSRGGILAWK